jgi:hypothetical protein
LTINLDAKYVGLNPIQEKSHAGVVNLATAKKHAPDKIEDQGSQQAEKDKLHSISQLDTELYLARQNLARSGSPENQEPASGAQHRLGTAVKALPKGELEEALLQQLNNEAKHGITEGFSANNDFASHRRENSVNSVNDDATDKLDTAAKDLPEVETQDVESFVEINTSAEQRGLMLGKEMNGLPLSEMENLTAQQSEAGAVQLNRPATPDTLSTRMPPDSQPQGAGSSFASAPSACPECGSTLKGSTAAFLSW